MTILDPRTEETLRQSFKRYLNPFMLLMWRLGLGPWINLWPKVGGRILVIAHRGRKTGVRRYTPVNYALVDGEIYCTVGFGVVSDWYRNLAVNPDIEVWLPDGWWAGVVEDISDSPWRLPLLRQVLIGSGVVTYLAGGRVGTFDAHARRPHQLFQVKIETGNLRDSRWIHFHIHYSLLSRRMSN